jgi:hypothetical protein
MFHPQVDPETGILHLEHRFPLGSWNGEDFNLSMVIAYVKRIFFFVELAEAANPAAKRQAEGDVAKFEAACRDCAQQSVEKAYTGDPEFAVLKFSPFLPEQETAIERAVDCVERGKTPQGTALMLDDLHQGHQPPPSSESSAMSQLSSGVKSLLKMKY